MRLRILPFLFGAALLAAEGDSFEAPPDMQAFARQHTLTYQGAPSKVAALIRGFFASPEDGGLGITYDNTYTRTPMEAWRDRKANCLTLTALYVAACKSIGIDARYGESLRVSRWRRMGSIIRYERHLVAVIPMGGAGRELVADFLPELRKDFQVVTLLDERRVVALFHSNRAVELLEAGRADEALLSARRSIEGDPHLGVGWNVLGVIQRAQGDQGAAEKSYLKALETDPKDGAPCGNLEDLMRGQGRFAEAQFYRDRGLEIRKGDPYFNAFLAEEALQALHWEEAEKRVKAAIRLMPQETDFYLLQARISLAQGQRKDAIKALEKARKVALPEMQARFDSKLALLKGETPT